MHRRLRSFTWANKTGNLPDIPVDSIIVNPDMPQQVYAGTDWGVYYTDDITVASPTWQRFENGIPHAMVWDMQIDRGSTTLSVWTRSRGAYVYPLPGCNDSDPNTDRFANGYAHGNCHSYADSYADGYSYPNRYTCSPAHSNATARPTPPPRP